MGPGLLFALLAAAPALTVEQRAYFAGPLIAETRVVQKALARKKIVCAPTTPFDESKPENWVAVDSREGFPASWMILFDCQAPGGMKQLAIQLYDGAVPAPRKEMISSGPGFFLRTVGPDVVMLGVGSLLVFDQDKPMSEPAPGPAKTAPRSLSVGANSADWLKLIPTDELLEVLARTPMPVGAQVSVVNLPKPEFDPRYAPAAAPYTSVTGPVPQVNVGDDELPLRRELSANQQAYCSTVAAQGLKAIAAALAPTKLSCTLTSGEPSCLRAKWGARGFTPDCWQSHWTCDGDVSFMAELSGAANAVRNGSTTVKALASDARLHSNKGLGFSQLVLGEVVAVGMSRPFGGIAPLGAVTLGGDDVERLLPKLDLVPLRALLHAPPLLPANPAAQTALPPFAEARRSARKAEVRRFVLESLATEKIQQLVLYDQTLEAAFDPRSRAFLADALPEVDPSAVEDFTRLAAHSRPVEPFEFRLPVRLLSESQQEKLFADHKVDGWALFNTQYPNARGIITLSEVGLSRDGTTAILAVDRQSHWLAGSGETWFLRKTASGWEKLCVLARWVS